MKQNYIKYLLLSLLMLVGGVGNVWSADKWVLTDPTSLTTGDIVVIVDQTSGRAMSHSSLNSKKAPNAVQVTISGDKTELTETVSEGLQWNVTVTSDGYMFNVPTTTNYLNCVSDNNGVRVSDGTDNVFSLEEGGTHNANFLKNNGQSRYLGVYSNQDWRCYTTINSNIRDCVTVFYKKTAGAALSSISISGTYPTTFHQLDAFSHEGMVVTATYDDNSTKNVTDDVTFSEPNMATVGTQEVTVSYTEGGVTKEKTYNIVVNAPAALESITLGGTYPTSFVEGSTFSHEGMTVTANYSDQTTKDVTNDARFSEPDMANAGTKTITVSYTEGEAQVSTTYDITVTAIPTHTVTWSVNGTTTTADYKEGATITPLTGFDIPAGYTFVGWSTSEVATTDLEPEMVTPTTMGDADITYYAVMAYKSGSTEESLTKLDGTSTLADGDNIVVLAPSDDKWYGMYQETISNSYVNYFILDHEVTPSDVTIDDKRMWTLSTAGDGNWYLGDDTNGYLHQSSKNEFNVTSTKTAFTIAWDVTNAGFTIKVGSRWFGCRADLTGNNQYKYRGCGESANPQSGSIAYLDIYKYCPASETYSGYCTTASAAPAVEVAYADGWMSYVPSVDVAFPENVEAYIVTAKEPTITREKVTAVPAGTPVVLHATDGAKTYFLNAAESAIAPAKNELQVSDVDITIDDDNYRKIYVLTVKEVDGVAKAGFGPLAKTKTLTAGKVYLEFDEAQTGKDFISFEDVASGIGNIEHSTLNNSDAVFNLSGQRVNNDYRGIVIMNGKKLLKK